MATAQNLLESNGEPRHDRIRRLLETTLGPAFTDGNQVDLLQNGVEIFPAMLKAIRESKRRIEFLTYIYWTGDIAKEMVEALSERARAGVEVMVLLDGLGARPMRKDYVERMEAAGCRIAWFRPLPRWRAWQTDNRTHRKILVCDGKVAFTGGVGIAAEWEGNAENPENWRDNHFQVQGPAVRGLRAAFYGDWMEANNTLADALSELEDLHGDGSMTTQVLLSQAAVGWNATARLQDTLSIIAEERMRIQTPYFTPGPIQTECLLAARKRGVEIEIMIPGPYIDKRVAEYSGSDAIGTLLDAGVRMWRYQPTMLHSKTITIDGELASVGSANFNERSIFKDNEVCLNVLDGGFTARMDEVFDADREKCEPLTPGSWRDRGPFRRTAEAVSNLTGRET
ncbi:phospholipase D-like domain-containing protein [Jannaschia seosinensis]|nr:phospholipase D-like domain-containing protein [Jannaschia seosinensis]